MQAYACLRCSYLYSPEQGDESQNIPPGVPFLQLPDYWRCPWCGVGKSEFVSAAEQQAEFEQNRKKFHGKKNKELSRMNELVEGISWVGYTDWTVRDFHGYDTGRGSTYGAYLIEDEKNALIDTVKGPYAESLLNNLRARVSLASIAYVICNHAEPDHAGALPKVMAALPNATVVCSSVCRKILSEHCDTTSWKFQLVDTGDTLSLGKRTLSFLRTPMIHWPESMMTRVVEDGILFSMDAFAQHYASSSHFADECPLDDVMAEAKTYYANIVMPYGRQVQKALAALDAVDIRMIAPAHGVIWRQNISRILDAYRSWATGQVQPRVLVLYDSMWKSTEVMAREILAGAIDIPGVDAKLVHVRRTSLTQIATEMLEAAAIAVGTPTLNTEMMPEMSAVLTYLKGLRPPKKDAFSFGSFGWGKGGASSVQEFLKKMKFELIREPLESRFVPDAEVLAACRDAGRDLGQRAVAAARA